MSSASTAEITARSSTLVNSAILRRCSSGSGSLAAAQQHVRLDADAAQLLHRMLRRLGLDLARAADDRHQRQVHVDAIVAAELDAELADGLEERQRLDVADRAADLDHADVGIAGAQLDAALDLVGDVRDHLHRGAEVVAAPLFRDHALVDAPGREVAVAAGGRAHEALVVAEVEVGLGAVLGDEDLAVLERAHRARVHVDVGVELDHGDLEAARLEDRAEARRTAMPLPSEDTTPPVTKTNRVIWNPAAAIRKARAGIGPLTTGNQSSRACDSGPVIRSRCRSRCGSRRRCPRRVTVTTRSWLPSGSSRQTVKTAAVAPMPIGWKLSGAVPGRQGRARRAFSRPPLRDRIGTDPGRQARRNGGDVGQGACRDAGLCRARVP